jgi:hypothetical protein
MCVLDFCTENSLEIGGWFAELAHSTDNVDDREGTITIASMLTSGKCLAYDLWCCALSHHYSQHETTYWGACFIPVLYTMFNPT